MLHFFQLASYTFVYITTQKQQAEIHEVQQNSMVTATKLSPKCIVPTFLFNL